MTWWALMGMLVSYFYTLQAAWFGSEANLQTVLLKVLADMAGFTIFIGAPFNAISHLWKDCGWDTARLRAAMGPGWYRRLVLPNLLTNYFVWFPGTLIFYSMPTDLQLVVANCIGLLLGPDVRPDRGPLGRPDHRRPRLSVFGSGR